MKLFRSGFFYLVVVAIAISLCVEEVEGRRKILQGRKALTRTYYRQLAIPAWAIVVLVAFGQIIIGAILYVIMRKKIIDQPLTGNYAVAPTEERNEY